MMRPGAPKLLVYLFLLFFFLFFRYCCYYHIFMLSLTVILFVFIVSQPSTNYPRVRFIFVLLRYVHEKKFKKIIRGKFYVLASRDLGSFW